MSIRLLFVLFSFFSMSCPVQTFGQYDFDMANWFSSEPYPWTGSVASGVNGRSGNANTMDINFDLKANRDTEINTTNIIANYFYGRNNSATVNDRAFGQVRRERKINDIWAVYFQLGLEFDRFKDFDYRIAIHSGFSRDIYRTDSGFLKARLGAGVSREVGSPNDDWIPELQLGTDWEQQLTDTTKIYTNIDYFPNVSDFGDFRLNTNVGLNFLVDAPRNISFRIFANNRYDSTPPPGNKSNDVDYGAALVWGF